MSWATQARAYSKDHKLTLDWEGMSTETFVYKFTYTPGAMETLAQVAALAPAAAAGYTRTVEVSEIDAIGCLVTVTVSQRGEEARKNAYGEIWKWKLTQQGQHITSVSGGTGQTQDNYPAGTIFDGNAIGVDGERINGVDIRALVLNLTITMEWADEAAMPGGSYSAFQNTILQLAQPVPNIDESMISGATVLFLGGMPERTDKGTWKADFEFEVGFDPGTVTVTLWDSATQAEIDQDVPDVMGHQYLWTTDGKAVVGGVVKSMPLAVHRARVYKKTAVTFKTALGIQGSY